MTYEEFFRERQDARYGGKAARAAAKFVRQALNDSTFSTLHATYLVSA